MKKPFALLTVFLAALVLFDNVHAQRGCGSRLQLDELELRQLAGRYWRSLDAFAMNSHYYNWTLEQRRTAATSVLDDFFVADAPVYRILNNAANASDPGNRQVEGREAIINFFTQASFATGGEVRAFGFETYECDDNNNVRLITPMSAVVRSRLVPGVGVAVRLQSTVYMQFTRPSLSNPFKIRSIFYVIHDGFPITTASRALWEPVPDLFVDL